MSQTEQRNHYTIHLSGGSMDGKTVEQEFAGWCFVCCRINGGKWCHEYYNYTNCNMDTMELWAEFANDQEVQL